MPLLLGIHELQHIPRSKAALKQVGQDYGANKVEVEPKISDPLTEQVSGCTISNCLMPDHAENGCCKEMEVMEDPTEQWLVTFLLVEPYIHLVKVGTELGKRKRSLRIYKY